MNETPVAPGMQGHVLDSKQVREYLRPIPSRKYWEFKKHPAWPKPLMGKAGGKQLYAKDSIDAFLAKWAAGEVEV
jgi:hypothetical protein